MRNVLQKISDLQGIHSKKTTKKDVSTASVSLVTHIPEEATDYRQANQTAKPPVAGWIHLKSSCSPRKSTKDSIEKKVIPIFRLNSRDRLMAGPMGLELTVRGRVKS